MHILSRAGGADLRSSRLVFISALVNFHMHFLKIFYKVLAMSENLRNLLVASAWVVKVIRVVYVNFKLVNSIDYFGKFWFHYQMIVAVQQ